MLFIPSMTLVADSTLASWTLIYCFSSTMLQFFIWSEGTILPIESMSSRARSHDIVFVLMMIASDFRLGVFD